MNYTLVATAPLGLESVVAHEAQSLGFTNFQVENGRVRIETDLEGIVKSNLWFRTADRILLVLGEFTALTFDELFEGTKALPWDEWLSEDARFPVSGRSHKSQLSSVPACQAIVKKAIVSKLTETYMTSWFKEDGATYPIEVALMNDKVMITLDTSGAGLHKRGYRIEAGAAPIKETLAAALVILSRWRGERVFLDPFCGSGTIAIEAAMYAAKMAPGLNREFISEEFDWIPKRLFREAREEANDKMTFTDVRQIYASDIDTKAIELAKHNAKRAGVDALLQISGTAFKNVEITEERGVLIGNPPYGERMGEEKEIRQLYRSLGQMRQEHPGWSLFILSGQPLFEKWYGKPADKRRKLYNGRIECQYYQYTR